MIPLSCPDMLFPVEEVARVLPKLKAAGFAAIELAWVGCGRPEYIPLAKETARRSRDAGLEIGAIWVHGIRGAGNSVAIIRRSALERMKPLLDLAVESNAGGVVTIDHRREPEAAPAARDEALAYLGESFAELGRYAAAIGTKVFLEPLSRPNRPLLDTIESAAEFCRGLGSPSVMVCADTYHAHCNGEDFNAALARAKPQIGYIHFSDFCSAPGKPDRPLPGFGEINFAEAIRVVEAVDYRGVVAIEGAVPDGMTALEACAAVVRRLRGAGLGQPS